MADEEGPEIHGRPAQRQQRGGPDGADQRQASPVVTLLQVEDVHQQFGALKVLNGISLAVPQGQALGVVGPNGAGKTTLIDIVAGGRRPGPGRVSLPCHDFPTPPPGPPAPPGLPPPPLGPPPPGPSTPLPHAPRCDCLG